MTDETASGTLIDTETPPLARAAQLARINEELRREAQELRLQSLRLKQEFSARNEKAADSRLRLAALNLMEDAESARQRMVLESTARLQVEESLRQSEEQFRRAIQDAPIPVIMHAEDGQVLHVSRTWGELTGFDLAQRRSLEGWFDEASGPGAGAVKARLRGVFQSGGAAEQFEFEILARNGDHRHWIFTSSAPGRLRDGRRFAIGMALDITERKRAEQELARSRAELEWALKETEMARQAAERANRTKDQFLATLSHELRTPLTPALLAAESLLARQDLPDRLREALEMICRNIEIETRFIDDLLDVSRIANGKLELLAEMVDVHAAVGHAIEVCQPDFERRRQRLLVNLAAESSRLAGDLARLQQVFWNLLKNASKFTPDGGEIRLNSRNDRPGWITVEISDTGRGINPGKLADIFQAFQQEDPAITRDFGGLGLGLAIALAVIEGHRGAISAASEGPGKGATFTIHLPLGPGAPESRT